MSFESPIELLFDNPAAYQELRARVRRYLIYDPEGYYNLGSFWTRDEEMIDICVDYCKINADLLNRRQALRSIRAGLFTKTAKWQEDIEITHALVCQSAVNILSASDTYKRAMRDKPERFSKIVAKEFSDSRYDGYKVTFENADYYGLSIVCWNQNRRQDYVSYHSDSVRVARGCYIVTETDGYCVQKKCKDKETALLIIKLAPKGYNLPGVISQSLMSDRTLVIAMLQITPVTWDYVPLDLKRDIGFARTVLMTTTIDAFNLIDFPDDLMLLLIRKSPTRIRLLTLPSHDLMLAACQEDGLVLRHLSIEMPASKDIMIVALKQNGMAYRYLPKEAKEDMEICAYSVSNAILDDYSWQFSGSRRCLRTEIRCDIHFRFF